MPPFETRTRPGAASATKVDRAVRCAACGAAVAREVDRLERDGAHEHTFFNPAGIVFAIALYSAADGAQPVGDADATFTWFPGFAWRVAHCAACRAHLGWRW